MRRQLVTEYNLHNNDNNIIRKNHNNNNDQRNNDNHNKFATPLGQGVSDPQHLNLLAT